MSIQTFEINNPDGAFRVYASDGIDAFDSRLQTQRIFMTGTADVDGPGSYLFNELSIAFGKTFATTPYARSASRLIDASKSTLNAYKNLLPPQLSYQASTPSAVFWDGNYTVAKLDSLVLGNSTSGTASQARRRFWYSVFENPIG